MGRSSKRCWNGLVALGLFCLVGGCNVRDTLYIGAQSSTTDAAICGAAISEPDPALGLDPFYQQAIVVHGIPILGSTSVDPAAMYRACVILDHLLPTDPAIIDAMVQRKFRVAVLGVSEVTTDVPEYHDLYDAFPGSDWDSMRGIGATLARPVSSVAEEDLLCGPEDRSNGEFLLPQTFTHGLRALGIEPTDSGFAARLEDSYDRALAAGLWKDTFAATNAGQYLAEGVQDWFDANGEATPANGTHNEINTRTELKAYDPDLAALIGNYLVDDAWRPSCP